MSKFVGTRAYDFVMAAPLILWFGYSVLKIRPTLIWDAYAILDGQANLTIVLQLLALLASAIFNLMVVGLLVVRHMPLRKANGVLPRLIGFAGTFLGVGILQLKAVPLSLPWLITADILILGGNLVSALVLAQLGRAFSIMPEARQLVTTGPYAYARHPLYAVEAVTVIGIAIQFQQPIAGLLAACVIALQITRSVFEERVLVEAYPEYQAYRARTARFVPGII